MKITPIVKEVNWEQELGRLVIVYTQYFKSCEIFKAGVFKHIPQRKVKVKRLNEWVDNLIINV